MQKNTDRAGVATHIVTYCSKCAHDTNHVVVAQGEDGFVARVKCIVCGSEHKYKRIDSKFRGGNSLGSATKNRNLGPKGISRSTASYDLRLWEEALAGVKNKVPENYLISGVFDKGDLLYHSSMGEGVFLKSYDNKIEVIFKDGIRILVHNRK
jgi:hypothetical protein